MSVARLDELLGRIERLPRLPATSLRLISIVQDPASTLEQIVDVIRYDPTATAELLRVCNSAFFGFARRIQSVADAIRLLGTVKVLQLVVAGSTHALLSRAQPGYGLRYGALWEHSVGVALASENLTRRFQLGEGGLLYTAGLLHDLGKVVLNEYVVRDYAEIVRRSEEHGTSFLQAEQDLLGFTHAEAGARLTELWNLPEPIVRCVRHHHAPDALEQPDPLVDVVHLADAACILMGIGGGEVDGLAYHVDPAVLARRDLCEKALEEVGAETVLELKAVRQLLSNEEHCDVGQRVNRG